ncbi:hypothetical protein [endosymbiont GvMRE of Glomus versiforme]|uniref:hypothetical protein n=1 Tax=endosymbiont GvMRE of Glomus versiforme TaxID=2039283 RepID=UPI000EDD7CA3|nr:hypothetical protein [endosymbiont GvMRE of Glomus versiforme]RHZ36818.1 hypothetical protein GvMRE_I2g43 [endosymbiont GvMRE of Glomus versiforme]
MNENINEKEKQQLEKEIERYKVINEGELDPKLKELNEKITPLEIEVEDLKTEVESLKTGYDGDDTNFKEYQKQLKIFDKFRFLRSKNGTQLNQRLAQVNIGGTNGQFWADRAMPANFLHSFLTCVMNFDTLSWNQIQHGFDNRGGTGANGSTLVVNAWDDPNPLDQIDVDSGFIVSHNSNYYHHSDTAHANQRNIGNAGPTPNSAEWVDRNWRRYKQYYQKMVAVGTNSYIKDKSEVIMPSWVPVRNLINHISSVKHDATGSADGYLFGSEVFIPYYQQVKVNGTTYDHTNWVDIKLNELRDFFLFCFPNGNNELLAKTGANDYRLTNGTKTYTLLDKDYKQVGLFPLYELDTGQQSSFQTTHGLDTGTVKHEWKVKDGTTDKWIKVRKAVSFGNTGLNTKGFSSMVSLFHQVCGNTQATTWINERSNETNIDQGATLKVLTNGTYTLANDKLVSGNSIISCGEPNSKEYTKKKQELDLKESELKELKSEYQITLQEKKLNDKEIKDLEQKLGKFTKKDKNALANKLKHFHNRIEAKLDTSVTPNKWKFKGNSDTCPKQTWENWHNFSTDYDEFLELIGTDETKWEKDHKDLINSKLKDGTHKYFKDVIEANYNKLTANYHKYITSKCPSDKAPNKYFEEWLKDKNNSKNAEKIVQDLEALKNFINLEGTSLGDHLKKISESELIATDIETALKRILGTDYKIPMKNKWAKSEYAQEDKFWKLVKDFYLKTEQDWKAFIKTEHGTHDNLKDWLKDPDLDIEAFIAAIRRYQIKKYVNSNPDTRKEIREKQGKEMLNWFAEVDKLGYTYSDISNSQNADYTAEKAYEELKKKFMGNIDEALGLNKSTDGEIITKWLNFKEYGTNEKIEALLSSIKEETKPEKEGGKTEKKIKTDFLEFAKVKDLTELLKSKSPQEVVAIIKRYELKDITEEIINSKEPKGEGAEFNKSKSQITEELESVKAKLEEIEKVGQTLTEEETKVKTAVLAKLASIAKMESKTTSEPTGGKPKSEESEETPAKETQPEPKAKGKFPTWAWWLIGATVIALGAGALYYFVFRKKNGGDNSEGTDEANEKGE